MKHYLQCPFCSCLHEYRKDDIVIAFFCPYLDGVIHFDFFTKERIAEHKKEAEPKSWSNIFRRGGLP